MVGVEGEPARSLHPTEKDYETTGNSTLTLIYLCTERTTFQAEKKKLATNEQ